MLTKVKSDNISELVHRAPVALLVIDIQNAYCSPDGSMAKLGYDVSRIEEIIPKIEQLLEFTQEKSLTTIFTRMIEDPKYMSKNAQKIAELHGNHVISSTDNFDFEYTKIQPRKENFEVIKKSYDAFTSQQLRKILDDKKISTIIIVGATSDLCVDTTVRSAYSSGYDIVVPTDLTATFGERLDRQAAAFSLWSDFFAHVTDSESLMNSMR